MNETKLINAVLTEHPKFESFEQVQAECKSRGTDVGYWPIYFAAKSLGRKLLRRPESPDPAVEIADLALSLLWLHKSLDGATKTLNEIRARNSKGERIPWETEYTDKDLTETWELSVGQELVDACGVDKAIEAVVRC